MASAQQHAGTPRIVDLDTLRGVDVHESSTAVGRVRDLAVDTASGQITALEVELSQPNQTVVVDPRWLVYSASGPGRFRTVVDDVDLAKMPVVTLVRLTAGEPPRGPKRGRDRTPVVGGIAPGGDRPDPAARATERPGKAVAAGGTGTRATGTRATGTRATGTRATGTGELEAGKARKVEAPKKSDATGAEKRAEPRPAKPKSKQPTEVAPVRPAVRTPRHADPSGAAPGIVCALSSLDDLPVVVAGEPFGRIERLLVEVTTGELAFVGIGRRGAHGERGALHWVPFAACRIHGVPRSTVVEVVASGRGLAQAPTSTDGVVTDPLFRDRLYRFFAIAKPEFERH